MTIYVVLGGHMKKAFFYTFFIILIFIVFYAIYIIYKNSKNNVNYVSPYNAAKTEANFIENNIDNLNTFNNSNYNILDTNTNLSNTIDIPSQTYKELSSFTTKIYDKDSARQNNVQITCNLLNNTEVLPGNIFSFTSTVRQGNYCKRISRSKNFQS